MKTALLLLAIAAVGSGCTSLESAHNTHQAREYLTEDIEDQVVFNLIRASHGLPFAHYDVTTVQSIVAQKVSPSFMGSRSGVSNGYQPKVVITNPLRAITRAFNGTLGAERNNSVTVNIAPVFDKPAIYASYVRFLNLPPKSITDTKDISYERRVTELPDEVATESTLESRADNSDLEVIERTETSKTVTKDDQDRVVETIVQNKSEKPKPKPVNRPFPRIRFGKVYSLAASEKKPTTGFIPRTVRKWGELWYYIPLSYEPEFSDLCLSLVARGDGGAAGVSDQATAKKLDLFNSQLMQQNTIQQTR